MNSVKVTTIDGKQDEHWQCCKTTEFTTIGDEAVFKITVPSIDLTIYHPVRNVQSIYVWEGR